MDKIQLLESVLGKGHKTNRDYYQFICPFHDGKNGPKLGVSIGTGGWKCWVCPSRGNSISGLFYKLKQSKDKIATAKELWKEKIYFKVEQQSILQLPREFKPLWQETGSFFYKKAKGYLESRGVDENEIIKHRLGYCESGKYSSMIIFPNYDDSGILTFWSGRTFNADTANKFCIPDDVDKNIIFDENLVNWSEPVIIVESKLDSIAVKRNVTYLAGKQINQKLKLKIIESETPEVIFCLDGDALNDAILQSSYFIDHGIKCSKVQLPIDEEESLKQKRTIYHDPSSLGFEKVWQFIDNRIEITESEIFKFKFLNRLR